MALQHIENIIIGAGPAGSTCAWKLKQAGRNVMIIDKADFPRLKLCAGWITTKVMQDLEFTEEDYPHSFLKVKIHTHLSKLPFAIPGLPTAGENFSIRRTEFDHWLLRRCRVKQTSHEVKQIRYKNGRYIIDDSFSCDNLIGAGGTMCPVRRILFPKNRKKFRQLVTLEKEFKYPARDDTCHLYFLNYGTKGYAWYFPKGDGYVNIGLGGKANYYKKSELNIHQQFKRFLADLVKQARLDEKTANELKSGGHPYYLYSYHGEIKRDNCYLIGDAAGLATTDLGEGIGPAIESAIMVAGEICKTDTYQKSAVTQFSTAGIAQKIAKRFLVSKPAKS